MCRTSIYRGFPSWILQSYQRILQLEVHPFMISMIFPLGKLWTSIAMFNNFQHGWLLKVRGFPSHVYNTPEDHPIKDLYKHHHVLSRLNPVKSHWVPWNPHFITTSSEKTNSNHYLNLHLNHSYSRSPYFWWTKRWPAPRTSLRAASGHPWRWRWSRPVGFPPVISGHQFMAVISWWLHNGSVIVSSSCWYWLLVMIIGIIWNNADC